MPANGSIFYTSRGSDRASRQVTSNTYQYSTRALCARQAGGVTNRQTYRRTDSNMIREFFLLYNSKGEICLSRRWEGQMDALTDDSDMFII